MNCPLCGSKFTGVARTHDRGNVVERTRHCPKHGEIKTVELNAHDLEAERRENDEKLRNSEQLYNEKVFEISTVYDRLKKFKRLLDLVDNEPE